MMRYRIHQLPDNGKDVSQRAPDVLGGERPLSWFWVINQFSIGIELLCGVQLAGTQVERACNRRHRSGGVQASTCCYIL